MITYLILALALLVGGVLLVRWFINSDPKQVLKVLRWVALFLGVCFILFMVFARSYVWLILSLFLLLPFLMNARALRHRKRAAKGPAQGQTSEVNTRFLRMTLNHDSGAMDGEVLTGRLQGRQLSDLSFAEQLALWQECQAEDAQSAAVLEAYLDRAAGTDWRAAAGAGAAGAQAGPNGGPMSRAEAYGILGLEEGAKPEEIREAHRRLMQRFHPDHGGSNYLAAKINEAKTLLLGE